MTSTDVAIVGAGAAGLATAIFAARCKPGRAILALDGAPRLGAKILVSGGGRCNVTNRVVTPADYFGGSRPVLRRVLSAFPVQRTVPFFGELGVPLHAEADGKLFPDSNRARDVVDALVAEAQRRGVRILTHHRVVEVARAASHFELTVQQTEGGQPKTERVRAQSVVLASGGLSLPKTGSDGVGYQFAQQLGHTLVPPTPALVPLLLAGDFHVDLSGIAQDVELTVRVPGARPTRLTGAMLWTHFGVSGPVVLNASRFWHRARLAGQSATLTASFLPGHDFSSAEQRLLELAAAQPTTSLHHGLSSLVPARLAAALLARLEISGRVPLAQFRRDARRQLAHGLLDWPLPVTGCRGYNYAEVTAGGVPLSEIDPTTMASRVCPGLYLVGEILDVDGRIGGFNFQWAWSSGWVAGHALP